MGDEVVKILQYVMDGITKLGPQAEAVWSMLVGFHRVTGIVYGLLDFILVLASLKFLLSVPGLARKYVLDNKDDDTASATALVGILMGSLIAVFLAVSSTMELPVNLTKLAIPEYFAVKDLMKMVGK